MSIAAADAAAAYLADEIAAAEAAAELEQKAVKHKKIGLSYIMQSKKLAMDANGDIDTVVLKATILAAVNLLQTYHDALP